MRFRELDWQFSWVWNQGQLSKNCHVRHSIAGIFILFLFAFFFREGMFWQSQLMKTLTSSPSTMMLVYFRWKSPSCSMTLCAQSVCLEWMSPSSLPPYAWSQVGATWEKVTAHRMIVLELSNLNNTITIAMGSLKGPPQTKPIFQLQVDVGRMNPPTCITCLLIQTTS